MASEPTSRQYVSPAANQNLIQSLERLPGDPGHGFFGPGSITWHVNRESAVFLGAGRAALLQLAHPWVAAALAEHSNLLHDAIGRFHSTFRVLYTMQFGTRGQATEAAKQLYRLHSGIRGNLPSGEHYEANETTALRWVYATLVESAIMAHDFVLPALTLSELGQYYAESKRMAALFGISPNALPRDWAGLLQYVANMFDSSQLSVDAGALALGRSVMSGAGTWLRPPHWYGALTSYWMPRRLRTEFELPLGAREEEAVKWAGRWLPRIYASLPGVLRYVGPFHDANARLRGRRPGFLIRKSNIFWMGQPTLG